MRMPMRMHPSASPSPNAHQDDRTIRLQQGGAQSDNAAEYWRELSTSPFCLAPPGHARWSLRMSEAILAGCVPVLFEGGVCRNLNIKQASVDAPVSSPFWRKPSAVGPWPPASVFQPARMLPNPLKTRLGFSAR